MSKSPKTKFLEIVKRYLEGDVSSSEAKFIENYYESFANEEGIIDRLTESEIAELEAHLRGKIKRKIKQIETPVVPLYRKKYIQVAAAFLIFSLVGTFYFVNYVHQRGSDEIARHIQKHDVAPGGNKAILTLASGTKLVLNQMKNGKLAKQPGAVVTKTDSLLSYKTTGKIAEVTYNTITIPKGGQYQLVLADGTKVWLNASSSLRFPTAFAGTERTVELTGEAYFEVTKNASKPFNVKTPTQTLQVLGTHFNINAYDNEKLVKTTLLEGSVKVSSSTNTLIIKPGQQSVLSSDRSFEIKNNVDTDEVIAWKNGMFQFNEADIKTIMRQIERWYDMDVEFQGTVPNYTYHGKISRNSNASHVLKILGLSGINFSIEGRKIIVRS